MTDGAHGSSVKWRKKMIYNVYIVPEGHRHREMCLKYVQSVIDGKPLRVECRPDSRRVWVPIKEGKGPVWVDHLQYRSVETPSLDTLLAEFSETELNRFSNLIDAFKATKSKHYRGSK